MVWRGHWCTGVLVLDRAGVVGIATKCHLMGCVSMVLVEDGLYSLLSRSIYMMCPPSVPALWASISIMPTWP
jgi:hypothetical protein